MRNGAEAIRADVQAWAQTRGYGIAWGPIDAVRDVSEVIRVRRDGGELDPELCERWLAWAPDAARKALEIHGSVLLISIPRPAHTISFALPGGTLRAVLPPTYLRGDAATTEAVLSDLRQSIPGLQGRIHAFPMPLKSLATRLGLAEYGRNNITYVEGIGSYQQLVAYGVDIEPASVPELRALEAAMMPECQSCRACSEACPTGAIDAERFLLHAERCLPYFNETRLAFPDFVPAAAHRCLIGCMACQEVCPVNAGRLRVEDTGIEFTEAETTALLGNDAEEAIERDDALGKKIDEIDAIHDRVVFVRNLRALVEGSRVNSGPR